MCYGDGHNIGKESSMRNQKVVMAVLGMIIVFYCGAMQEPLLDPLLVDKIYKDIMDENAEYRQAHHEPLIILLSGCAGMGKSTVAKALQQELKLVRFDGDATRKYLKNNNAYDFTMPAPTKVGKILACFSYLVARIKDEESNKSLIFDESLDRKDPSMYDLVSRIAEAYDYPIFIIRLNVDRETAWQRVIQREKNNPENLNNFKKCFDSYYDSYANFNTTVVDYYVDNNNGEFHVDSSLREKIEDLITLER